MARSCVVRTNTAVSGQLSSSQHDGVHRWEVSYLDPATGDLRSLSISCNSGTCPKEVLESMGVPFDFGVEITFV